MGIRTALDHNSVITFALIFVGVWIALIGLQVVNEMGPVTIGDWVGQHGVGGLMGLLALAIVLGLLIVLFGELGTSEPAPEEWPPESESESGSE